MRRSPGPTARERRITDEYLKGNISLRELADREGLSRQRIHQLVVRVEPDAGEIVKCLRVMRREEEKAPSPPNKVCVICEEPFFDRGVRIACCSHHSELFSRLAYHLDPKRRTRQLVATAKYNLKTSKREILYSQRLLNGEPTAYRGRWVIPGSKVAQALNEANTIRISKGLPPFTIGEDK